MAMEYIKRPQSVITGKKNLEPLYTFKDFPVFFGCVTHPVKQDLRAEMSWAICPETGVIQLDKLIPLKILYQEQHVDGTGPTWAQYYRDLADYIARQHPKDILEIGGGRGALADIYIEKTAGTAWTMIEPNPLHPGSERIKVIPAFFDENFKYAGQADTVVFSQLMEHVYDPQAFMKTLANYLKPGKKLIFAYPNLQLWLKRKYTNALNFEHTMFLTDYFVDHLLCKYGFEITDKTVYREHSHFYTAQRLQKPLPLPLLENKYWEYKKIFLNFTDYHESLVKDLNQKIEAFNGEVYLFGAHIFAQFLLEFGLHEKRLTALLDNSKLKIGKRLYGSSLKVFSPEIIAGKEKVGVILKVGIYREEIGKQLKDLNPEVIFFE